jgi:hypothetical protein
MTSLISAIRAAIRTGALPSDLEDIEADADASASNSQPPLIEAPTPTGGNMSENQTVAGAAGAAALAIAAAATSTGGADGFKTAMDRMSAILGADGIKGDGKRMAAALDLATQSPDMAADAVVAFVSTNVSGAAAPAGGQQQATSYEQLRLAAAGLAQPGATVSTPAAEAKAGWGRVSSKINSRNA